MATTFTVKALTTYIAAGLNISVIGIHGVGKTAKLRQACDQLGLKLKYYSASTLDPFTDLVGIPVPNTETKTVEYFRPKEIDEAEVVIFDEANRADPKTINTIFEIVQFKTINGEPLPNLKSILIAMNPVNDEYTTEELDPAFLDRFDVTLQADPEIDRPYFIKTFGERLGNAAVDFWEEYEAARMKATRASTNKVPYISPRRMEMITSAFRLIPMRQTVVDVLPPEITDAAVVAKLYIILKEAMKPEVTVDVSADEEAHKITMLSVGKQQSAETGKFVAKLIKSGELSPGALDALTTSLASALREGKTVPAITREFSEAVKAMKSPAFLILTSEWPAAQVDDLRKRLELI